MGDRTGMDDRAELWNELAAQLAVDSIRCTTAAGSGHPTSSMSAAHLAAVLYADHLRTHVADPTIRRTIDSCSRRVSCPGALLRAEGDRRDLGRRAAVAAAVRLADPRAPGPASRAAVGRRRDRIARPGTSRRAGDGARLAARGEPGRVWVMVGRLRDGRGFRLGGHGDGAYHGLNNLDRDRSTSTGWASAARRCTGGTRTCSLDRAEAFGWHAVAIDGHDVRRSTPPTAGAEDRPTDDDHGADREGARRVVQVANAEGWHGKALSRSSRPRPSTSSAADGACTITPRKPEAMMPAGSGAPRVGAAPVYAEPRSPPARRSATPCGGWPVIVTTWSCSTARSGTPRTRRSSGGRRSRAILRGLHRGADDGGAQVGMQALGKTAFSATFGAFFTRAYDFVRMAAIGRADLRLCGSHAGVSIGEDGPSQMALEDLATMRAMHSSTVLYPADGNATVSWSRRWRPPGISYIRTTREATKALYDANEAFPIGGSQDPRVGTERPGDPGRSGHHGARVRGAPRRRSPTRASRRG